MQLTQQIKVEPNEEQKQVLWGLSEKCRLIYNFGLKERIENWEQNRDKPKIKRDYISYTDQQNELPKLKQQYPEYKWVYAKVLQMVLKKLDADYKSFFALKRNRDKKSKPPKFKGRKYFTTMCYNQSGFKVEKEYVELSHKHPSNIDLKFRIPEKFDFEKIYQVSIYQKDDDFYISVVYEKREKEYVDNGKYQAFDLGITKHTAVNTESKFIEFYNKRPDKYWQPKIEEVQSRRDHCKKNSNRWKWYSKKLNKMKRKSSNQLKDFQHKLSRKIVDNTKANTIIVGKLSVKKMSQINKYEKGLHKSMHNTGNISRFVRFLTYKAKIAGKRVIEINERGTTKTCCVCGKKQNMPLYKRIYRCDCGNAIDRDKNSAVNIMKRFLSQKRFVNKQPKRICCDKQLMVKRKFPQKRFGELARNPIQSMIG